jgi:hypothetical protein
MLWGAKNAAAFQTANQKTKYQFAAGFNEYVFFPIYDLSSTNICFRPDIASQSNLSPGDACGMWMQYLAPLKNQGTKLLSPAPAIGPKWLSDFKNACPGAQVSRFLI